MKKIGLLGGMGFASTLTYYEEINKRYNQKSEGNETPELVVYSFDFSEIERLQSEQQWDVLGEKLSNYAERMRVFGVEGYVICANTMHYVAEEVEKSTGLPVLHIAKALSCELKHQHVSSVLLLGTRYVMQLPFYKEILEHDGIEVHVPERADQELLNRSIYDELVKGIISETSKQLYQACISKMIEKTKADAVVLGCTELQLLLKEEDVSVPLFDTTSIHIDAIVTELLKR